MSHKIEVIDGKLKCSKCGIIKPVSEFSKGKNSSGYKSHCKECVHKAYLKDKERILAQHKTYYENNKEKSLESCKKYRDEHKEERRAYFQQYYIEHSETLKENHKKRYEEKADEINEKAKEYVKRVSQTERYKNYKRNYRQARESLKRNLENTLTEKEWQELIVLFNGVCAYCGKKRKLTQDHIIPITKGGGYTKNNIIPCCGSCNSSKQNKNFEEWYLSKPFFNESRLNRIKEVMES